MNQKRANNMTENIHSDGNVVTVLEPRDALVLQVTVSEENHHLSPDKRCISFNSTHIHGPGTIISRETPYSVDTNVMEVSANKCWRQFRIKQNFTRSVTSSDTTSTHYLHIYSIHKLHAYNLLVKVPFAWLHCFETVNGITQFHHSRNGQESMYGNGVLMSLALIQHRATLNKQTPRWNIRLELTEPPSSMATVPCFLRCD